MDQKNGVLESDSDEKWTFDKKLMHTSYWLWSKLTCDQINGILVTAQDPTGHHTKINDIS